MSIVGDTCLYLAGHMIGPQPSTTAILIQDYLDTWAAQGLFGAVKKIKNSSLLPWFEAEEAAAAQMSRIVGALPNETVLMGSLTSNLHLLMGSFYQPNRNRSKIIIEEKAFSSDYVGAIKLIVSQILTCNNSSQLNPSFAGMG